MELDKPKRTLSKINNINAGKHVLAMLLNYRIYSTISRAIFTQIKTELS